MALSDYARIVVDQDGNYVQGEYDFGDGVTVELYKCYVVVRKGDERLIFWSGEAEIFGVELHAIPAKHQRGILFTASKGWGDNRQEIAGIGVYGYRWSRLLGVWSSDRYIGVLPATLRQMTRELRKWRWGVLFVVYSGRSRFGRPHFGWEKAGAFSGAGDKLRALDFTKLGQTNAGDAFFAEHFGEEIPVGDVRKPIFHKLFGI